MSTASVQPGMGNDSGLVAFAEPLQDVEADMWPEPEMASIVRRRMASCPNGTTNWY